MYRLLMLALLTLLSESAAAAQSHRSATQNQTWEETVREAPRPITAPSPDTTALSTLRPLADRGDTRAALLLGRMHAEGHGVPASHANGLAVLRRSALAAEPDGLAQVGFRFLYADAFPGYDPAEALRWFTAAVERGSAQGAFGLGLLHKHGRGIPQSDSAAAAWFRIAANGGVPAAELLLATLHDDPEGPLHDPGAADRTYARLAANGGSDLIWAWVNAYMGGPREWQPVPVDPEEAGRLRRRMPRSARRNRAAAPERLGTAPAP